MNGPSLVILAAGLGSRYGDTKQVAAVGPNGEWLLEYAIHDALAAGFGQIILVIKPELREPLQARLAACLHARVPLHFVTQNLGALPRGCHVAATRTRPLGTGHALWCCASLLDGPFAVINADDYYGQAAFGLLSEHFRLHANPAMVGYRLAATLSEHGGVNRGICRINAHGRLENVTEFTHITDHDGVLAGDAPDGTRTPLRADATVSLNCWGLLPDLFASLERGLRTFLEHAGDRDEYFLPHAIAAHLVTQHTQLSVLPSPDAWLGLTYAGDRPHASAALAALHARGQYPTPLWERP